MRVEGWSISEVTGTILFGVFFGYAMLTPDQYHLIDTINLIFHEAGHTIFAFFGEFIHVLMGSGTQVLIPLLCAAQFYRQNNLFAVAVMVMWAGQSMHGVAVYAADAQVMQLELLGGDNVIHDWNYLLHTLGLLKYTPFVSGIIYLCSYILYTAGLVGGLAVSRLPEALKVEVSDDPLV
jgi:hypothetical protein